MSPAKRASHLIEGICSVTRLASLVLVTVLLPHVGLAQNAGGFVAVDSPQENTKAIITSPQNKKSKTKPGALGAHPKSDRVIIFDTKEPDLLKTKFQVSSEEYAHVLMSNEDNFWSISNALKPSRTISRSTENLLFQVLFLSIDDYKVQKANGSYEVINNLRATASDVMPKSAVLDYLRTELTKRKRIVRVVLMMGPPTK